MVSDLQDCEMMDRSGVERLNAVIARAGAEKVEILKDTTVSRTAINLLEWTRKKLQLEHEDSADLTTELQLLRVTKSLQSLIKMGGHDNQKAAELKSLDRKIEFVAAANRDSLLGKKLKLMKVKKKIKQQNRENERLYETVQELEAAVKERMQISSIRGTNTKHNCVRTRCARVHQGISVRHFVFSLLLFCLSVSPCFLPVSFVCV